MFFLLSPELNLRGWDKLPFAIWNSSDGKTNFPDKELFMLLYRCDGKHEIDLNNLTSTLRQIFTNLLQAGYISECREGDALYESQKYHIYPCSYKESVQWSITGHCNYLCRHCLMSADKVISDDLSTEECVSIIEQLAECGIHTVSITGGEPLIRNDLDTILYELKKNFIQLSSVYTNASLINGDILNIFQSYKFKPDFFISFDGIGRHDWMRGVSGAEQLVMDALQLCSREKFPTHLTMSIYKDNLSLLKNTIDYAQSMKCRSVKAAAVYPSGNWIDNVSMSADVEMVFQQYLDFAESFDRDRYTEAITLDGAFAWSPADNKAFIPYEKTGRDDNADRCYICNSMKSGMYIDPEGYVLPCMAFCGSGHVKDFPNIFNKPLRQIINDSVFSDVCNITGADYFSNNPKCEKCEYRSVCMGGCRGVASNDTGEYSVYKPDTRACTFFKNGWYDKFKSACIRINNNI